MTLLQYLLDHGADLNAKDSNGLTALMCACRSGLPSPAEILIRRGAEINATDNVSNQTILS